MGNGIGEGNGRHTGTVSTDYHDKQIKSLRREFEAKRDDVAKEAALGALEELKRRLHAIYPPQREGLQRCSHVNESLAALYWLQHQIKIGEVEL